MNSNQNERVAETKSGKGILPKNKGWCWPECGLYGNRCHLRLTLRTLEENRADMLVIPYQNYNLDLYPGSIVKTFDHDYREKIKNKEEKLKEVGSTYLQKCVDMENFNVLCFVKVEKGSMKKAAYGILNSAKIVKTSEEVEIKIDNIVFPVCEGLGDPM